MLATCWALSSPKKNPNRWQESRKNAEQLQQKIGAPHEDAILFGWFVIGTKALSETNSRPGNTFAEISKRLATDPDFKREVEGLRQKAIPVASKL